MYSLTQEVVKGISIVAALQNYPKMPGVLDMFKELDYLEESVKDSERYYGVVFKRFGNDDDLKRPKDQFDVISDVKGHFEEFYFGGSQEITFGFRPRAYYRLVVEPLLDSMVHLSHDEILDSISATIEQIKELVLICDRQARIDPSAAYKMYKQVTTERGNEKKIKEVTAGVMKLRRKSIALAKEIAKSK